MFVSKMSRIISLKHNLYSTKKQYSFHKFINIHLTNIRERIKLLYRKSYQKSTTRKNCCLLTLWTRQCEFVLAQRIRRGQQMFTLYSKLWEEHAFKELLKRMRQQVFRRGRNLVFSAAGITTAYSWNDNIIKDSEIFDHIDEICVVKQMRDTQLVCTTCNNRLVIDKPAPKVQYCQCPNQPHTVKQKYQNNPIPKGQWEPFIERKNIIIWRKEIYPGKFAYKMLGMYKNICANDYLQVQINLPYRKKWDESAVELRVVDKHNKSHSDIVYWEMKWPRFFSNRDYVFNRRYYIDEENKIIVLVCKSTEHPMCPIKRSTIRVTEYWSILVVRPLYSDLNQPGCEFCLTYFDDPGMALPEAMTTWIAVSGMPDFMQKMHKAAKAYRKHLGSKDIDVQELECFKTSESDKENVTSSVDVDLELESTTKSETSTEESTPTTTPTTDTLEKQKEPFSEPIKTVSNVDDDYEQIDPLEPQKDYANNVDSTVDDSFWRYLRPLYFFN
ncbi:stAR-related lipid transfer protein 7, mitochondrial-like [Chrysoperla carnea]|uniref:stAR-related lipid transfer protein 7, mitochondrial-like n=1 Tax=Chrysoperla carnea TaxID=189513 RepID=UPI001D08262B|nr:stAR-related lipid transfer protein 7, mitochondrial-like [Chrysoperla carnea]